MRVPAKTLATALAASTLAMSGLALAKLETWKHDSAAAFGKGKKDRVVVSDAGKVRLGRALKATDTLDAARVWDLARVLSKTEFVKARPTAPDFKARETVYAATGDAGKVFKREGDGPWTVAHDDGDSQALCLAALPDGRVFAGTGPNGRVVEVSDPEASASRPDPGVLYIWDLAADPKGNLYAATGPTGQLWKRSPDGDWSLAYDAKQSHLLSVAVGPDGSVYAGTDGEGLIYKVDPAGKPSVLYDAAQSDVRALLVAPDGTLYAGTAAEAGGSGGRPGGGPPFPGGGGSFGGPSGPGETRAGGDDDRVPAATALATQDDEDTPKSKAAPRRPGSTPAGGTATPRSASPGENAVYRFGPDGVAREVFRGRVLVHALAWQDGRLLVGTGPEGTLVEVRDGLGESAPIARLDNGQVLALLAGPGGSLLVGAGDPGAVLELEPGYVAEGTLVSDVLDAKLPSRFGAVGWQADAPEGTSVALQVRTGNVGEPDATWSDWSAEQSDPATASAGAPMGRFAQWRLVLRTTDPARSPEVRSVAVRYQTANLPPEITRLDVPDVGSGDGATRQAKLSLRWDASDPNGDDLGYTLHLRKEGWPDWVRLGGPGPITETRYEWDATAVPAGTYRLKLSAADEASNPPGEARSSERISDPFVVDHAPPAVELEYDRAGRVVTARLEDDLTRIARAAYALDGGEWTPAFPADGLFDTPVETLAIKLPDLGPGTHVLMVRAADAAGNLGVGDLVISVD